MERNPWWRGNLPAETSGLIGPETEIRELLKLLAATSSVTATGTGTGTGGGAGGGTSRIAVKAAEECRDSSPDGTWLAELSGERDGDLLASTVAAPPEVREHPARPRAEAPPTAALHEGEPGVEPVRGCSHSSGGATAGEPLALVTAAMAATWRGAFTEAVSVLEEVQRLCDARGERWTRACGDYVLSIAQLGLGRVAEATVSARRSLDVKWRFRDATGVALAADQLAVIAAVQGDGYRTARLQGGGARLRAVFGLREFGSEGMSEPRTVAERTARQLLGDDGYDAAFAEGHDDDPDSTMAYALG
ncbi:hypothetical protein AB0B56_14945 [Streptosporangium canum]|uniref:hypothetical protein n=1 Tax=Streptosporangium canum TaxID=324952 RepID=UPI00343C7D69